MTNIVRGAGAFLAIAVVALAAAPGAASAEDREAAPPIATRALNPQPEPPGAVAETEQPAGAICQTCEPSPPPPPGPTGPPPPKYVFDAIGLWVGATEDSGFDKIYIKINGRKVWGPYSVPDCGLYYCEHPFFGAIPLTWFSSFVKVSLYDEDWPDADDHLGTWYVWFNAAPYGGLHFNLDGADYYLEYRISGPF